ncbi:hypothetical protein DFH29DRAFT_1069280 [Suillus ampliporus]|nr:hypothetical protein DFH29DRAFT_1069280 [Suillus ampliporus]
MGPNPTQGTNVIPLGDLTYASDAVVRVNSVGWQDGHMNFESIELNAFIGDSPSARGEHNIQAEPGLTLSSAHSDFQFSRISIRTETFTETRNVISILPSLVFPLSPLSCSCDLAVISKTEDTQYYYGKSGPLESIVTQTSWKITDPAHNYITPGTSNAITPLPPISSLPALLCNAAAIDPMRLRAGLTPTVLSRFTMSVQQVINRWKGLGDKNIYLVNAVTGLIDYSDAVLTPLTYDKPATPESTSDIRHLDDFIPASRCSAIQSTALYPVWKPVKLRTETSPIAVIRQLGTSWNTQESRQCTYMARLRSRFIASSHPLAWHIQ